MGAHMQIYLINFGVFPVLFRCIIGVFIYNIYIKNRKHVILNAYFHAFSAKNRNKYVEKSIRNEKLKILLMFLVDFAGTYLQNIVECDMIKKISADIGIISTDL